MPSRTNLGVSNPVVRTIGRSWWARLLLCTILGLSILYYFERPVPGAGGSQPSQSADLPLFAQGAIHKASNSLPPLR